MPCHSSNKSIFALVNGISKCFCAQDGVVSKVANAAKPVFFEIHYSTHLFSSGSQLTIQHVKIMVKCKVFYSLLLRTSLPEYVAVKWVFNFHMLLTENCRANGVITCYFYPNFSFIPPAMDSSPQKLDTLNPLLLTMVSIDPKERLSVTHLGI